MRGLRSNLSLVGEVAMIEPLSLPNLSLVGEDAMIEPLSLPVSPSWMVEFAATLSKGSFNSTAGPTGVRVVGLEAS